ncbi:Polycomb protein EED [Strongyloides ratti]|uniref:Polycomb protein EED n=1 Tax=Strongyloides ratti TaxID=34506 RepID=A0A090LGI6_STRRB|nr:Polycomb protein EED [Strongyloides ratti]CEF67213.1 Polycomb protein EED [Strongyloides ratti]
MGDSLDDQNTDVSESNFFSIEKTNCIDENDLLTLKNDKRISEAVLEMFNRNLGLNSSISHFLWKSNFDKISYIKMRNQKSHKGTGKQLRSTKEVEEEEINEFQYKNIAQIRIKDRSLSSSSCYDVKFFKSFEGEPECFITACKNKIFVYKIGNRERVSEVVHIGTIASGNEDEEFFALNVGCIENNTRRIIVAGGTCKVVQVYRATDGILMHNLYGHSEYISSIKFSPIDPEIIITASGDVTCRMWNIKHGVAIACFSGAFGHHYDVSDCDFSLCGNYIATVGKDYKALLWGINNDENSVSMKFPNFSKDSVLYQFKLPEFTKPLKELKLEQKLEKCKEESVTSNLRDDGSVSRTTFRRFPIAVNQILHSTIIDSVRFFKDYLITKDQTNIIKMWKFGSPTNGIHGSGNILNAETRYFVLKDFILPSPSDTWYRKISLNKKCNILAVPTQEVAILDHKFGKLKQIEVRNIAFSNNSNYIVSVGDNHTINVFKKIKKNI